MQKKDNNIIATVSVAHLVQDTYSAFLAPILPLLIDKLGMSLVMSAFLDIARKKKTLFIPISNRSINYVTNDSLDSQSLEPDYNHNAVHVTKV